MEALVHAIEAQEPWECSKACFRIVYELPAELQLELACFMVVRYLPIFERRYPEYSWPRRVVKDLSIYDTDEIFEGPHEAGSPGAEEVSQADKTFLHCFNGLGLAYSCFKKNIPRLTHLCMATIRTAIQAHGENVWQADQPEDSAIVLKQMIVGGFAQPMRKPQENVAYRAVEKREWIEVFEWLARKEVENSPVNSHEHDLQKALDAWDDVCGEIVVPEEIALKKAGENCLMTTSELLDAKFSERIRTAPESCPRSRIF